MHDDYMNTQEVADFLKVSKSLVEKWRRKGVFLPDVIGHDKRGRGRAYYYSKERILQLASVYKSKSCSVPYAMCTEQQNCDQTATTSATLRSATEEKTNTATIPVHQDDKQSCSSQLANFFNQLYGKIPAPNFVYLITFKNGIETYSFSIADESQIEAMAQEAIKLANNGFDVWHAVNPVSVEPTVGKRGDEFAVSYQTAIVVDIDIRSDAHKGDQSLLAANFDEAKSFLPFTPSLIIFSGYGLHAYYIFNQPIKITDDNREELKRRNNLLLDIIRQRANGKKIDGVGDLPRVLRTPCTFNYKLGADNAPMCHIVEDSGLRFTPNEIDEKLSSYSTNQDFDSYTSRTVRFKGTNQKSSAYRTDQTLIRTLNEDKDFNIFRARRMLDFINPSTLTYDEWLAVGMALKNIGMDYSDWEQWSRSDDRFRDGECQYKWNGFDRDGYDIGTLYHFATPNGYDAQETSRQYYNLHPNFKPSDKKHVDDEPDSLIDSLKAQLRENSKALADLDTEKKVALDKLRNLDTFDSDSLFADDLLTAAAFAFLFDKKVFSDLRLDIKNFGIKNKNKKVSVNDWLADVKDKAASLRSRRDDLITQHNEILAKINSITFVSANDVLKGLTFPEGYSISSKNGIEKVKGESLITVCRRPVVISRKFFDVEEKKYKVTLSYMTSNGLWKSLPATSAAIVANKNKLVDLAENGLPVTSSNSTLLVDFLDAFNAQNETNFPITYTVPRCGWYNFDGKDFFVDPRRDCLLTDENKNINVVVDSLSQFAKSLRQVGSIKNWKRAYELAKKSPVARIMIAAAIAPILLKILGERNFLLHIYAPTRAGKTTALYLAASAIGDEKIIRSFDATRNGLAGAAADVSDFPFLIDEKQVADSRIKEQFDTLVYSLANGIGRTKLNKDSTLRKLQDWRTIAIMTGETQLLADNVTGGANTRLLTIAAPKIILSADDCKTIRNIIKENYGLIFPLVINKIFELGFENLHKWYNEIVDSFSKAYPDLLNDYCRYMAIITLADAILNSVLGNKNVLEDAILAAKTIFPLIPTNAEISDTARERDFVLSFIAQNQSRFIGGNIPLDRMQMIYGKLDGVEYVYITVKALQDACKNEGYDYRKLVDDLVADDFFVTADTIEKGRKAPRSCVKQRIGQMAGVWCHRIKRESL